MLDVPCSLTQLLERLRLLVPEILSGVLLFSVVLVWPAWFVMRLPVSPLSMGGIR